MTYIPNIQYIEDRKEQGIDIVKEPSLNDLAKDFSGSKSTIKLLIKECNERIVELQEVAYKYKCIAYEQNFSDDFMRIIIEEMSTEPIKHIEKKKKFLEKVLSLMSDKEIVSKSKIFEQEIQKAREVPISDFISFDRSGKAKSIFNTSDKTPSMHYYKKENRVHCFSTGRNEDVIGVIMEMHGLSFVQAVNFILKK